MVHMMKTNIYFQLVAPLALGYVLWSYQTRDLEERTQQLILHSQLEKSKMPEAQQRGSEETKKALSKMLRDLPNKTTRQKLEDAVDAAHRTHGIGFPDSPNSPKDRGLPTSFHDHDPSFPNDPSFENKDIE
eukprot:CAMPEP_0119036174 /NCGR_PEP_ID=MMETSP1177-20130426/3708_1 /TAXON_ID=2985 /ORGANISM="Ochromonas sp, Strain CCMP1899" /LENGTH=130 /DNA_ID=CAMNT_0006995603 /DNA_START=90 /DNA_END=482 /DNA_ORIENTATION=-